MTLIGCARFACGLAGKKIDLDHARMELWDLRQIHAERPHRFQRRVDDDFLSGSKRRLQILSPDECVLFRLKSWGRDEFGLHNWWPEPPTAMTAAAAMD